MPFLVIDIGNSYVKAAVFVQNELEEVLNFQQDGAEIIQQLITRYTVNKAIISSVKKEKADWEADLAGRIKLIYFNNSLAGSIINHYRTPNTLGLDRLAAVIGAHQVYPAKSNLIIDAGTCITYDWVDRDGNYYGGSISPGLNMRYRALNNYTSGLPLIDADKSFESEYGDDTRNAIISGVQNGIRHELTGFIESYRKKDTELNILLTGGDGIFFDTLLKNSIFAPYIKNEPYLVLKGLNAAIQEYND